ncbi:MAG: tRNA (adenosine(37)-N6)-threonylcarbamoyltransferase complex transferase subunit TsaD [Polyangiales bacterium]
MARLRGVASASSPAGFLRAGAFGFAFDVAFVVGFAAVFDVAFVEVLVVDFAAGFVVAFAVVARRVVVVAADFFFVSGIVLLVPGRPSWHEASAPAAGTDGTTVPRRTTSAVTAKPTRPLPPDDAPLTVLGVESSCDETAAAVVRALPNDGGGEVLSDVVWSQVQEHAPYGGVVPEIASRAHLKAITPVMREAVDAAGGWGSIDAVAVTAGPGLVGALLVGVQAAKAAAWARGLPLVGVNHLAGHLLAPFLLREQAIGTRPRFPFVALLASGGHTALYRCDSPSEIRELGATRDDAAGEAFDKVAKLVGLGYPGGPVIDRLARDGDPTAITLPRPMRAKGNLEFSFSGLKTAVAQHVAAYGRPADDRAMADLAASVQAAIVETLVRKLMAAARREGVKHAVISGGVAANRGLRAEALKACEAAGIALHVPPARSCTDNAAMIAWAGAVALRGGRRDGAALEARASWPLGS